MFNENEKITTIEQAKEFYIANGCSEFHMWHDHTPRYEEYKALEISKETQQAWRVEHSKNIFKELKKSSGEKAYWLLNNYLEVFTLSYGNVKKLYRVIRAKYKAFEPLNIVILAEMLYGVHTNSNKCCLRTAASRATNLEYKYLQLIRKMCLYAVSIDPSVGERVKELYSFKWLEKKLELWQEIAERAKESAKKSSD